MLPVLLTFVIAEHFHAGLSVRVVSRLEAQFSDPYKKILCLKKQCNSTNNNQTKFSPGFFNGGNSVVWEWWTVEQTQFDEELMQNPHQVTQRQAIICHHALDLMELCQVSGVQRLVAKHTVYREVLHWCELLLNDRETRNSWMTGATLYWNGFYISTDNGIKCFKPFRKKGKIH